MAGIGAADQEDQADRRNLVELGKTEKPGQLQHNGMSHPLPANSELRSEPKKERKKNGSIRQQQVIDACTHSSWWLTCFELAEMKF